MNIRQIRYAGALIALAVTVACSGLPAVAAAKDRDVTVTMAVDTAGLNLTNPADATTLYKRLKRAAWMACTSGDRINLAPVDDTHRCVQMSLGNAVRTVNAATLTGMYLAQHTLQEAAAVGINVPLEAYNSH